MSEYRATVAWERGQQAFSDNLYSRGHTWQFDGGLEVPASSSPSIVPLPLSIAEHVDPEEAFVASLSSCHMLFFLSLAQAADIVVDSYRDCAIGVLERRVDGKTAVTRVTLRPQARYSGDVAPTPEEIERLHHRAHQLCFIANSVTTAISTEIVS